VAQSRLCKRGDGALRCLAVDLDLRPFTQDDDPLLAQLRRRRPGQLERVRRLQVRLVAAVFDPRRNPELVEQLGKLERCCVDHLEVALLRLAEVAHPHEGLREAVDRRERRAQIVCGERDKSWKSVRSAHRAR
jgi:hypothetical protein